MNAIAAYNSLYAKSDDPVLLDPEDFYLTEHTYYACKIYRVQGMFSMPVLGVDCDVTVKVALMVPEDQQAMSLKSYEFVGKISSTGEAIYTFSMHMETTPVTDFGILFTYEVGRFIEAFKDFDAMTYLNTKYRG